MSTTITARIKDAANQHALGDGAVMFFVNMGKQTYNRKTKEKVWTNYTAALYAKQTQVDFYTSCLVAGAVVSITCKDLIIDMPTDPNHKPRLEMVDASLDGAFSMVGQQGAQSPQQAAPQYAQQQAPQQQAPQQQEPQQQQQPMQRQPQQRQQAPTLAQQAAQHPQAQPMQQQPMGQPPQNFDNSEIPF